MMEKRLLTAVATLLVAVLGWSWTTTFSKLVEIEKELKTVQIELARMQSTMLTQESVKELILDELMKHGIK